MRSLLTKRLHVPLGRYAWSAPVWALLLALAGEAFFLRLGFWQLGRATEKVDLTQRYEARAAQAPLDLAAALAQGEDVDDLPVRLRGRYDNTRAVYLDNQTRAGRAGFHVHTVFFPEGEGRGILVNRGWVPAGPDMQVLPPVPPAQAADVAGTLARPSPFFTVGEPDYRERPLRVARIEMDKLSKALGVELRPFVIRLDSRAADGFVREWSPADRLGVPPEKHRAYAFQWFALAAAVIGVLVVVNLRKGNSTDHE